MADPTLLDLVAQRFGVAVDPDSDGGRILGALKPAPPLAAQATTGQAVVAPLTFALTADGVSVRAAENGDALVLTLPPGPIAFRLLAPDGAHPAPRVELTLTPLTVPAPFLRPGQLTANGALQAGAGDVHLNFPSLLLIVTASAPRASARLAPAGADAGALEVTMTPALGLIGPGAVVGIGFDRATLTLEGPGAPHLAVPTAAIHVVPPGIDALALHGEGRNLRFGLAVGDGPTGDFKLTAAPGGAATRPRFVQELSAHLILSRGSVTLVELSGKLDIAGEVSAHVGPLGDAPAPLGFTLALALDDGWRADLRWSGGAGAPLWRTQSASPGAGDPARNTLGAYSVFAPLLAGQVPAAGGSGYADLALAAGASVALAGSKSVSTRSIALYGGELVMHQPAAGSPEAFLFFDLETELDVHVKIGGAELLSTKRPVKARHRAIGLRLDFGPNGATPKLTPVFDTARGFTLDLSDPGLLEVPGPLGDILQPEGLRMARTNPLNLELDLVLKADLGVVSVDKASVRVPLDAPAPPTLTALGAHVDVPGALTGGGYLKLLPGGGFEGSLDAAVAPPLGIRVAAGLAIEPVDGLTGVLVTLGVELPVAIPLANSGLGLFGVSGLFGMHFQRDQPPGETALKWYVDRAHGEATDLRAWKAAAHHWAFGLGAVIGTVEGGFLVHAKGMVVIELPGPRVLLVMNADILGRRPGTHGKPHTGTLLAVIEISEHSLTIGVVAEYAIKPLLELRVPAEAFFDFDQPENWHLDIGGIPPRLPASVKFFDSFRADGYVLIHGNGIPDFPLRPLRGFAVAAGVRAAFTWGPEAIGLYLRIAAQADVGISFKPMLIIGKLKISGELHLFIISIEASAAAEVVITPDDFFVSAEVCGSVDFFFFDVSGCVKLELGSRPNELPPAEPLVRALSLHSRSPALATGTGTDRAVDGSLGDASHLDGGQWVGELPVVPIDAIPALQMEMRPVVDPACTFLGRRVDSKLAPDGWLRRGERFYRYTLRSLELSDGGGGSPVGPGDAPTVWWDRYGAPSPGDDNEVQLALLSWIPDPTPAAAERTTTRDERVKRRWGDVCAEVAPPAHVLWAFHWALVGPSPPGWTLAGSAWPDPPGTRRHTPPPTTVRVDEPWRSGDALTDALTDVSPAYVIGADAAPGRMLVAPRSPMKPGPALPGDGDLENLLEALGAQAREHLADAVRIDAGGLVSVRLLLFVEGRVGLGGLLAVRPLDGAGGQLDSDQPVTPPAATAVFGGADLPSEWVDPDGPWLPLVEQAFDVWTRYRREVSDGASLVLMTADLPEGTMQVEVGLETDFGFDRATWGLLLVEGLTAAEVGRYAYDDEDRRRQIAVVDGALGADQANRALLHPDTTYTVTATYDVLATGADDAGNPKVKEAVGVTGREQRFRFKTDARPPERLDPWVLATAPGPGEQFAFYGDPLRVVFATNATRALFEAYGLRLFAVAKAASGRHPPATPGFDPAHVSLAATLVSPATLSALAATPFGAALQEVAAELDCVEASGATDYHERVTLRMKLEPVTDYILDFEAGEGAGGGSYPLMRRHFSTSRYESMAALAVDVRQTPIRHRRIENAAALAALATPAPGGQAVLVSDVEFEQMLRELRWGDLARVDEPRVTVIWRDASTFDPPQPRSLPAAVLIEAPEPLWRTRNVPQPIVDAQGTRRYAMRPYAWLDIAGPAPNVVPRIVRSSSGTRTLVVLTPLAVALTKALDLSLRRTPHWLFDGNATPERAPLISVEVRAGAPWEPLP